MRRLFVALACAAAVGCGNSVSTPKVDDALKQQQEQGQKQADSEEREYQKQQKKK